MSANLHFFLNYILTKRTTYGYLAVRNIYMYFLQYLFIIKWQKLTLLLNLLNLLK